MKYCAVIYRHTPYAWIHRRKHTQYAAKKKKVNHLKWSWKKREERQRCSNSFILLLCISFTSLYILHLVHPAAAPLWKREKEEETHTHMHAAYSHSYTISLFWVKVSGRRSRICCDRTGTTAHTQCHVQHSVCDDCIFPQCVYIIERNVVNDSCSCEVLYVYMWTY